MFRLLADENLVNSIVRGFRQLLPKVDFSTVQEMGLSGTKDPELLTWAARESRMLVTHDKQTMGQHFTAHLSKGLSSPGIIVIPKGYSVGRAIGELRLIVECSELSEWRDQMIYLPL